MTWWCLKEGGKQILNCALLNKTIFYIFVFRIFFFFGFSFSLSFFIFAHDSNLSVYATGPLASYIIVINMNE